MLSCWNFMSYTLRSIKILLFNYGYIKHWYYICFNWFIIDSCYALYNSFIRLTILVCRRTINFKLFTVFLSQCVLPGLFDIKFTIYGYFQRDRMDIQPSCFAILNRVNLLKNDAYNYLMCSWFFGNCSTKY